MPARAPRLSAEPLPLASPPLSSSCSRSAIDPIRGRRALCHLNNPVRKTCIFIGSRANYSSIKSVMHAVQRHPDLRLQLIVGASALLDRFGSVVDVIEDDGF